MTTTDNPVLKRQLSRWYKLKPHPTQIELKNAINNGVRFPIVPAGRRSGKTERFKRFVATEAMTHYNGKYFMGAPTNAQAKKIFWDDMLELTLSCLHTRKPNLTDRIIYLPTGSEIHVIGLENAKRIEGIQWTGGGIDEVADVKGEYFGANIFPALDTVDPRNPDYRAWCWLLGVPDGLNHYYDMTQDALSGKTPDAKVFHWKSSEILPPDLIEAAKRRMSRKQYLQEYEASFETAGGKIYEDYSTANHTTATIQDTEVLHWSHDQNYTPLSSCIAVIRKGVPYFLDEIVLESAVSRQSALEFLEKFKNHKNKKVYIYGDPAGRAGEKHGHQSDYTAIEDVLRAAGWAFERRVRKAHPAIKDRQNAVRTKVCSASGIVSLYVNPVTAPWCHKALATCQLKHGSSFQEDETNQYQHISTAIGYFVERMWPLQGIVTTSFNTTGY